MTITSSSIEINSETANQITNEQFTHAYMVKKLNFYHQPENFQVYGIWLKISTLLFRCEWNSRTMESSRKYQQIKNSSTKLRHHITFHSYQNETNTKWLPMVGVVLQSTSIPHNEENKRRNKIKWEKMAISIIKAHTPLSHRPPIR